MTATAKPGSARFAFAPMAAVVTALAVPAIGGAAAMLASPAAAEQPGSFAAPSAPFAAAVTPAMIVSTDSTIADAVASEPAYKPLGSGMASYYGRELAGNRTASGERFNPADLTAAHRTLPLGSRVRVTNTRTGDSVIVRINDRGPFHGSRLIDLSEAAAREIGIRAAGSGRVEIAVAAE